AIISAPTNWLTSCVPYRLTQPVEPVKGSVTPYASPAVMAEEIGKVDMFCTPPATTRSWVPDMTPWAAKCTACCEDPHCRSTVVPGTSSGSPAASQQVRATSPACEPMVSSEPKT